MGWWWPTKFLCVGSSHIACVCARPQNWGQWVPEIQLKSLDESRVRFEGRLNFRLWFFRSFQFHCHGPAAQMHDLTWFDRFLWWVCWRFFLEPDEQALLAGRKSPTKCPSYSLITKNDSTIMDEYGWSNGTFAESVPCRTRRNTLLTRGICVDMSTIYVDMLLCLLCRSRNFFRCTLW